MFVRWVRLSQKRKHSMWRMYGWFTGLMCCGSIFGTVSWLSYMQFLVAYFTAKDRSRDSILPDAKIASDYVTVARFGAAYIVTNAAELCFLSVVKLMMLFRTMDLSVDQGDVVPGRWIDAARITMKVVTVLNAAGLCSTFVAAAFANDAARLYSLSAAAFAANVTGPDSGEHFFLLGGEKTQLCYKMIAVQEGCWIVVLLLIITSVVLVGSAFARFASDKLRGLSLAAEGDPEAISKVDDFSVERTRSESRRAAAATVIAGGRTRRKIVSTAVFVFVTFLLRASYEAIFGIANAFQNRAAECGNSDTVSVCDSACYNVYALMQIWLIYTPEFQMLVVLISSPLALLVALWGMTTDNMSKPLNKNQSSSSGKLMQERMLLQETQ